MGEPLAERLDMLRALCGRDGGVAARLGERVFPGSEGALLGFEPFDVGARLGQFVDQDACRCGLLGGKGLIGLCLCEGCLGFLGARAARLLGKTLLLDVERGEPLLDVGQLASVLLELCVGGKALMLVTFERGADLLETSLAGSGVLELRARLGERFPQLGETCGKLLVRTVLFDEVGCGLGALFECALRRAVLLGRFLCFGRQTRRRRLGVFDVLLFGDIAVQGCRCGVRRRAADRAGPALALP